MNRFRFRLETLLDYRDYLERRAQIELAHAVREVEGLKREMTRIDLERREIAKECDDASARGLDVPLYLMYRSYLHGLDQGLEKARMGVKRSKERLIEKRAHLKKQTVKKKTLCSLKERRLKQHLLNSQREVQKTVDELVLLRGGTDR